MPTLLLVAAKMVTDSGCGPEDKPEGTAAFTW
jgi:hypothetical protein